MNAVAPLRGRHLGECGWFWVWALIGGCGAISFISYVGVFFLPVAAVSVFVLLRWGRDAPRYAALGLVSGAGVPFLVVAYIQRNGPSDEHLDPLPWLVIGILLVLAGAAAFLYARASTRPLRH